MKISKEERYEKVRNKLKTNFNDVINTYVENECTLLSQPNEYKNNKSILKFICKCGKEHSKDYSSFKKSPWCNCCGLEKQLQSLAIRNNKDYDNINQFFIKNGCSLITKQNRYKNTDYVEFKCKCGCIHKKTIKSYYKHPFCDKCLNISLSQSRYFDVKAYIENSDCILITPYDEYQNHDTILNIKCKCGNIFNTTFTYFKHENKRTCDDCGRKLRSGENHYKWKGGATSDNEKIRKSLDYTNWRNSIFERDNYTCQCCGDDVGGNLQAHHIVNFSEFEDLRFDITNGICLCANCHNPSIYGSFHHTYGTFNNNAKQLDEYIKLKQSESQKDSLLLCSNE